MSAVAEPVRGLAASSDPDGRWRCAFNRAAYHHLNLRSGDRLLQLDHEREGRIAGSLSGVLRDGVLTCGHSAPFGGVDLVRPREAPDAIAATVDATLAAAAEQGARELRIVGRPAAYGPNDAGVAHALLGRGATVAAADLSYVIALDPTAEDPAGDYLAGLKRPARKALRHLLGDEAFDAVPLDGADDAGWRAAHALLDANRRAKGRRLSLDADQVLAVRDALGADVVRMLVLRHGGRPCAAALVYAATAEARYVVAWGDADHELPRSPMNLLALRVVEAALADGARLVDLGISSVPGSAPPRVDPGLARFKESVGARPELRLTLHHDLRPER